MGDTTAASNAELIPGASAALAQALGVPAEKVSIHFGDTKQEIRGGDGSMHILSSARNDDKFTAFVITAEIPGAQTDPNGAKEQMRDKLSKVAPIAAIS